ncbi:MAG: four helix bundle protein [Candidatus Scalindua sp. AMX11]|nr:MAG: four helix bundle protein [Candidatus Scalindua sp.]NOG84546.1 four helix bundle protein [Planctomycetota bacterium]RZV92323.1 MAG: four helix bundle protein [Candidatus Scalindua sp. SCAELEC01]TDE66153.1 MAG: four helix bundle protein [Candidatus Scalindua sp. AMX11]GJQ59128.1 MAG: four helix bundle protein [Candidatus Scalindua sp.]
MSNDKIQSSKHYDLEDRTFKFAKDVIALVNNTPKSLTNIEISKQLVRSAGSVGANYIEANESLSKKDFIMRIKICRKEAKESRYWLKLINCIKEFEKEQKILIQESNELTKIFGAILEKSK